MDMTMKRMVEDQEQIQAQALGAFKKQESKRGTICLSTGTGKSKVAIDFIKEIPDIKRVLITSPRTNLKENWRKELLKWGLEEWRDGVWAVKGSWKIVVIFFENVQSSYKEHGRAFDLIIADEIHTMMTPEYSKLFERTTYKYLMGLTATHDMTSKNDKEFYYRKYCPVIYEYYNSAEDGIINKTRYFIVLHALTNEDKVLVGSKNNRFLKGELEYYNYLTERMKAGQRLMLAQGSEDWFNDAREWFWNGNGTPEQKMAAMRYLNAIKYRKQFLQSLGSTARIAGKLVQGILTSVHDSKILVFSELTSQIEKIVITTVHSHNSEEVNQNRIDLFNRGNIRALGSCQSLTLGLNLKGATHGIMESYVGSVTRSKQKKGRLDRLPTDDIADMWIIRVVGTQSDKWFEQMTKGFDLSEAITVTSEIILNDGFDYSTSKIRGDT